MLSSLGDSNAQDLGVSNMLKILGGFQKAGSIEEQKDHQAVGQHSLKASG